MVKRLRKIKNSALIEFYRFFINNMGCIDERRKNIMIWKFYLLNGIVSLDKFVIKEKMKKGSVI